MRTFRGGLLRAQLTPDRRPFLANVERPSRICNVPNDGEVCYVAGKRPPPPTATVTLTLARSPCTVPYRIGLFRFVPFRTVPIELHVVPT